MLHQVALLVTLAACINHAVTEELKFQLYAYGSGIKPGLQLFYGDGQLILVPCGADQELTGSQDKRTLVQAPQHS
jgi:hypothetical protein